MSGTSGAIVAPFALQTSGNDVLGEKRKNMFDELHIETSRMGS